MANNDHIELSESNKSLVDKYLASGKYSDVSEVVNASLNILQEEEAKIKALRVAIQEGDESGIAEDFSFESHRKEMAKKHGQ